MNIFLPHVVPHSNPSRFTLFGCLWFVILCTFRLGYFKDGCKKGVFYYMENEELPLGHFKTNLLNEKLIMVIRFVLCAGWNQPCICMIILWSQ